jgi:hypothetical protein
METAVLALALLVFAVALVAVGVAGLAERLPRNRWIGVRSPAVQRSDEAWRVGHRAGGAALVAAAGPPLLLAAALIARPPDEVADWFLVYAVVGVITGGLIALAVRQADRAAATPDHDG